MGRRETFQVVVSIECELDDDYFTKSWDELTDEQRKYFEDNGGWICEGYGIELWCEECVYCKAFNRLR